MRCSRCRRGIRPRKATVAIILSSCTGVTFRLPWPMATEIVSPGNQRCLKVCIFQALPGTSPAVFIGHVDAADLPQSHHPRVAGDGIDIQALAQIVEKNVAGILQGGNDIHGAMPAQVPAMELAAVKILAAGTMHGPWPG